MINREHRCSECLVLQKEEMEPPYVCEECERKSTGVVLNTPDYITLMQEPKDFDSRYIDKKRHHELMGLITNIVKDNDVKFITAKGTQ